MEERKELEYESRNGILRVEIVRTVTEGLMYDIQIREFPTTGLMGSYNDFNRLREDIMPFLLRNMDGDEINGFLVKLDELLW